MKLEELKAGEIYKCKLSGLNTLVFKNPEVQKNEDGEVVNDKRLFGKCSQLIDGVKVEYFVNEIFDGQLEETNN